MLIFSLSSILLLLKLVNQWMSHSFGAFPKAISGGSKFSENLIFNVCQRAENVSINILYKLWSYPYQIDQLFTHTNKFDSQ